MTLPEELLELIEKYALKYPDDIQKAKETARRAVRRHPSFEEWVDALVDQGIEDKVDDARHTTNQRLKKQQGGYAGSLPGNSRAYGTSTSVLEATRESLFDLMIDGRRLGGLVGSELEPLAEVQRSVGEGYNRNARLLDALAEITPADDTVENSVSEKQLRNRWEKAST